jgi:tetratricopeptide (TPR) repeat protein
VKFDRQWSETEKARVRACLDKVLASPIFAQAARQQRFLRYLVDETLGGNAARLKGYTIGIEVFERDRDFDPLLDAIVRVEATRLRAKLREYYDGEGSRDAVRLAVPKGSYGVRIDFLPDHEGPASRAGRRTGTDDDGTATPTTAPPRVEDRPSVVVLPFLNLGPDPAQQYFADGITEDLTTELSRLSGLVVISRHSAFAYKGVAKRTEEWRKRGEDSIAAGGRAVAMDPNSADAHLFLSLSLSAAGRGVEALLYIEKGMRLNPHPSSFYQLALGQCYVVLEDYERAIEACRRGVELRKAFIPNQFYLCLLYTLLGREDEAKLAREAVLALTGGRRAAVRPMWLDESLRLRWDGLAGLAGLENA